jgi:hypothetical protein
MSKSLHRVFMILVAAVLLPVLAQTASADTVVADFNCGGANLCSGGPVSGPPYVTVTNVTNLLTGSIASLVGDPFSLSFDTSAGTASLFDAGANTLLGNIVNGSTSDSSYTVGGVTYNNLTFVALWNLSGATSDVQNFFGGQTGQGFSTVHFVTSAAGVQSVDVTISSTVPEPGAITLLGAGLLFCVWVLRRNKQTQGATALA